jgi:hypothetical protein
VLQLRQALEDKTKRARVLASITALKKLCNHPKVRTLPVSFSAIVSKFTEISSLYSIKFN